MGINFKIVHLPVHFQDQGSLRALVQHHRTDFLAYTNANREHIADLPVYRGFHVVRDPRDVVVSAYFSHLHSHPTRQWPELEAHREELRHLPKEEGLFCEMAFSRQNLAEMYDWDYEQDHILELKMEQLTAEPVQGFLRIIRFLDLLHEEELEGFERLLQVATLKMNRLNQKGRRFMPGNLPMFPTPRRRLRHIAAADVHRIVQKKSFNRLAGGRKRGQEDVKSHYRRGVPGDWRNHFSEDHIRYFKRHYNDLLVKLGYESSDEW